LKEAFYSECPLTLCPIPIDVTKTKKKNCAQLNKAELLSQMYAENAKKT